MKTLLIGFIVLMNTSISFAQHNGGSVVSGGRPTVRALILNFGSRGSGTDTHASQQITELINAAVSKNEAYSPKFKLLGGREGEYSECIEFVDSSLRYYYEQKIEQILEMSEGITFKEAAIDCSEFN